VLWAVGMLIALVTIGLLVAKLYPSIWEALSRERVAMHIGIGVALTVIIILLTLGGASLGWTGFGDKTFWDWLQLLSALAIPVVLAAAGLWFTAQQDARQQKIENQRDKAARKIQRQNAQDEALQAYLDQMSTLLLEKNLPESAEDSEVRSLARARTLTVLSSLDSSRQGRVVRFLSEAGLINRENTIVPLGGTRRGQPRLDPEQRDSELLLTFAGSNLSKVNLQGADLSGTDLSHLNLKWANLAAADLTDADLSGSILAGTNLTGADLRGAKLDNAAFVWANLFHAEISSEERQKLVARDALTGAMMPNGSRPFPIPPEVEESLKKHPEVQAAQTERKLQKLARQIDKYDL
jgi:hypothetical protein